MAKKAPHPLCTIYTKRPHHKPQFDTVLCINFNNMPLGKMRELSVRLLNEAHAADDWDAFQKPLMQKLHTALGSAKCTNVQPSQTTPFTVEVTVRAHVISIAKEQLYKYLSQFDVHVGVFP